MKKLAIVLALLVSLGIFTGFQTHTFAALDTTNAWTGTNTFSGPTSLTGSNTITAINNYGGVATVAGGVPALLAKADATAQAANIGATILYTVPAGGAGMYWVSGYNVVTQAATVSSTLASIFLTWTDNDSGVIGAGVSLTNTSTANSVGATGVNAGAQLPGVVIINAKAGTAITFVTANYASSGATPMQYAIHLKLGYLGN